MSRHQDRHRKTIDLVMLELRAAPSHMGMPPIGAETVHHHGGPAAHVETIENHRGRGPGNVNPPNAPGHNDPVDNDPNDDDAADLKENHNRRGRH